MEKKECPLISIATRNGNEEPDFCKEDKCAWWDENNQCCIVHALSCLAK